MSGTRSLQRLDHLTFRGNLSHTRYGWLRLTPAYSIHLVADLLDEHAAAGGVVLDPFCGTGTTALLCAERGIACDTGDINPFLVWLARVKTRPYLTGALDAFREVSREVGQAIRAPGDLRCWVPPLHQIEKWWDTSTLGALARAMSKIGELAAHVSEDAGDLLKIAFCRTMIGTANVSFGHQSMSFKNPEGAPLLPCLWSAEDTVAATWEASVSVIAASASSHIGQQPKVVLCDARTLSSTLAPNRYTCVITSPPYPNRMSYIRELRPYMYWLGYLRDGREAGELDWRCIGGTWGCATSNLSKWEPEPTRAVPFDCLSSALERIGSRSPVLARYVHKYFYDMAFHCEELLKVVKPGGVINYIVGNSKFYDVLLPVEAIYAWVFEATGFERVELRAIRKRTSKKELLEYLVSARKPEL